MHLSVGNFPVNFLLYDSTRILSCWLVLRSFFCQPVCAALMVFACFQVEAPPATVQPAEETAAVEAKQAEEPAVVPAPESSTEPETHIGQVWRCAGNIVRVMAAS